MTCFQTFSLKLCSFIFRGRRSIWCGWRVTFVSPRIVIDVSNVTRINHETNFVGTE